MCNLYSITTNQAAIAALFRVVNRYLDARTGGEGTAATVAGRCAEDH